MTPVMVPAPGRRIPPPSVRSIPELLARGAESARPAFLAPGRDPLSYAGLRALAAEGAAALGRRGIGRGDRVALALPNGPAAAATLLAVASCATAAPLNPAYRAREFEFYLTDLGARALLLPAGAPSEAREVARAHGIAVLEVEETPGPAGSFRLHGGAAGGEPRGGEARPDDVALVLHTSGTTSRPKVVPLIQAGLCHTAHNIRAVLELTAEDRCLNVMPLFHVHGILNAMLSTLVAGGSTVFAPGFDPVLFPEWLREFRPTWYTAVPTIHQGVLQRVQAAGMAAGEGSLRFIRSSSAPLPPPVAAALEAAFGVPVIESYGMTEVDQIACNPLPPLPRKPGSVGLAGGPEVVVLGPRGEILPAGETGEVAVRGPNVMPGYENNPQANAAAFVNGFFRTGDLGRFDGDGYLFLAGRLKEIVNRGGEKVAPREVDEVLLAHPAVAEAAAFGVPHPQLGEEVAAAVVLRPGAAASPQELRAFVARALTEYKVPREVHLVDALPKGPTGKLLRAALSERFGAAAPSPRPGYVAPRTPLQEALAAIWEEVLEVRPVGVRDDFLAIGGTSFLAGRLFVRIEAVFGRDLPLEALLESSTVEELARVLEREGWEAPVGAAGC